MIFVSLIYGHVDILMPQYAQMNKSHAFQGYAKVVFWLHIARTENPDIPQTKPSASNFHEFHSDTPRTPQTSIRHPPDTPRHLQGTQDAIRRQQMPTDTPRHPRTPTGAVWVGLTVSVGACCRLLVFCVHWRWLGGVWGVSEGCLGVSEWYSEQPEVFGYVWGESGFSVLAVWSQNTTLA